MPPKRSSKAIPESSPQAEQQATHLETNKAPPNEELIAKALYASSPANPNAISMAKAADIFGVKYATLTARRRGQRSRKAAHAHQQ